MTRRPLGRVGSLTGPAFARLVVAALFLVGSNLLPIVHFKLCDHQVDGRGTVVHSGHGAHDVVGPHAQSHSHCNDAVAHLHAAPGHSPAPIAPCDDSDGDACLVFQAIQQSFETVEPSSTAEALLLEQGTSAPRAELESPEQFKRYLLAPSQSPPRSV